MEILKDVLDRRKWSKDTDLESANKNNMVTKDVECYSYKNYGIVLTFEKTFGKGLSLEVFENPEEGFHNTIKYKRFRDVDDIDSVKKVASEFASLVVD